MHVAIVAYSYGVPFAMVSKKESDLSKLNITESKKLSSNDKKIYLTWSIVDRDLRELKNIDDLRSWHQEHYNSSVKA